MNRTVFPGGSAPPAPAREAGPGPHPGSRGSAPPAPAREAGPGPHPGSRGPATLALLGLALAACPLPQPLPEYSPGQTVTPPRIVVDDTERRVTLPQTFVKVPAGCGTAPTFDLRVHLRDSNTTETIEGRWFVNYDARVQLSPTVVIQQTDEIQADPDAETPQLRQSEVFRFAPYSRTPIAGTGGGDGSAAGAVHVVEFVVSNGFDTGNGNDDTDRPNRRPHEADSQTGAFEVQLYRWVFVVVAEGDADEPCP